ncbi:MAG: hypothetical protein ACK42Y_00330 [Candidatus Thermochlorobacter sp.]
MIKVTATLLLLLCSNSLAQPLKAGADEPLRLHLVWQLDATAAMDVVRRELPQPTVRHLVTSTFFPLAMRLYQAPDVPATLCMSSETLTALQRYVSRLREFIDLSNNTIDAQGYLKKYGGETDAWLDVLLKSSTELSAKELDMLLNISKTQQANGFSVSEEVLRRFPEYARLLPNDMKVGTRVGTQNRALYTVRDRIRIKFFYTIAHFDISLLNQKYQLPLYALGRKLTDKQTGVEQQLSIDLSDYFTRDENKTPADPTDDIYELARPIGEDDCQRLVVETYKMMEMVLFILRQSSSAPAQSSVAKGKSIKKSERQREWRLDIITTPAFNALIPLLIDSDVAKEALGDSTDLPLRLNASADARAHIARAVYRLKTLVGSAPKGFAPHALMISQASLPLYEEAGALWILAPKAALSKALRKPSAQIQPAESASLYRVSGSQVWLLFDESDAVAALRERLQKQTWSEAVTEWLKSLSRYSGEQNLLTLRLDLHQLLNGKMQTALFLEHFFTALGAESQKTRIIAQRPSEVLNTHRNSKLDKGEKAKRLEQLVLAAEQDIQTWMSSAQQQMAWTYLALAREDLERSNLAPPTPDIEFEVQKQSQTTQEIGHQAWFELYAAEQSMWFKHYGEQALEKEREMENIDKNFRAHLDRIYDQLSSAGRSTQRRTFAPIVLPQERKPRRLLNLNDLQLDGLLTETEWFEFAGIFSPSKSADFPLSRCYYGITNDAFCFAALAKNNNLTELLSDTTKKLSLLLGLEENTTVELALRATTQAKSKIRIALSDEALEVIVPYSELKLPNRIGFLGAIAGQERVHDKDAYLGIALLWQEHQKSIRVPKEKFRTVQEDKVNTVAVRFELDLSAKPTARSAVLEILQAETLAPQKIALRDDGREGDEKRNDKVWSVLLKLRRGELIEYRYVSEEQSEVLERPRTWRVEDGTNTPNKAVVRDVFEKLLR